MADEPVDAQGKPESRGGAGSSLHALCALADVDQDELQKLLDAGADPNEDDSFERAPLSLLCMTSGHFGAAGALLTAGASPSSPDAWGRTSLHWCCDRGWLMLAELLLARGAPVNACTKQGDTPLLWAAKSGHLKLVELLLKSGADPLLRNNRDEAAVDVAVDEVLRTLISSAVDAGLKSPLSTENCAPAATTAAAAAAAATTTTTTTTTTITTTTTTTEDAQKFAVQGSKEKAPAASSCESDPTPRAELGSRVLAGLPMGGQVGTSGTPLFSAYKKQPMSLSAGSGSGPGPKKMKITLKKK